MSNDKEILKARIKWSIVADVECPNCGEYNNFMDEDEWWTYSEAGENKDFPHSAEIICKKCKKEIEVIGSDY